MGDDKYEKCVYFDIYLDGNGQEKRGECCEKNSVRPCETIDFLL